MTTTTALPGTTTTAPRADRGATDHDGGLGVPPDGFARRHIGLSDDHVAEMLADLGHDSLSELVAAAIPAALSPGQRAELPQARSEVEALQVLRERAARCAPGTPLIGMGYAATTTPQAILRNLLENPAWYTAYTPYQAEISQGRLEALLHFQTMVCDLTGLDVANASLLDEATAAGEAMALSHRAHRGRRDRFLMDRDVHPQTAAVVATRAAALGVEVVVFDPASDDAGDTGDPFDDQVCGVLVQYPGSSGAIPDLAAVAAAARSAGALVVAACDPLALAVLPAPGAVGADVAVGTTQRFGVPLWYGGPHAGFIAVTEQHRRALPGRLVGVSVDADGRAGLRLALQAREQHIRRERATSNICTAQSLPAIMSVAWAIFHGPDGIARIARRVHDLTTRLASALDQCDGVQIVNTSWFDTLTIRVPDAAALHDAARARDIELREVDATHVGISLDETTDVGVLGDLLYACAATLCRAVALPEHAPSPLTAVREPDWLRHRVFLDHHSETALMRLLRRWSDRDLALDRGMIPLGSCTMKLNAAAELAPVGWPEFANLHPFVPAARAAGLHDTIAELEHWLAELTGFAAVTLQPNAGSQGEFAGLLAIRRYHESRGDDRRTVVLIPASAHGTNAASATMAGLDVEVVDCDERGNVDLADLRARCEAHADDLAGLMITYPSTHGVFEDAVVEIIDTVHGHGGQVYLDGANLNAMVGWVRPGDLGADVAHLNLHKTFAIPHGGGGPGVGPIGVAAHLVEHLPSHPVVVPTHHVAGSPTTPGGATISAAPWGSAGILAISWAYVAMMGSDGLAAATATAILSANHLAANLDDAFPVLYRGPGGLVAHECILDLRDLTAATGVTAEDVAKRLVDYGFHAPTMSFPVPGTLMVEPTESEPRAELERFVAAMRGIRAEIDEVARGEVDLDESVLRHAPHPADRVATDDWSMPYSRQRAAFPVDGLRQDKYWPPVGRVDNATGDRNPICACPPMTDYTGLV